MMTLLGIVLFFLGILLSVVWHELGHFATAKWFGIKVTQFMVGFGRTIYSRTVGETEFGFKAVPLGGYIRMIGMIPPVGRETTGRRPRPFQRLIDEVREQSAMEVWPEDVDRQFYRRAPWKRIVVMFAGPFMNLVLALLLFAIQLIGIGLPTGTTTTLSAVSACVVPASAASTKCPLDAPPAPAAAAGFRPGDRIVAFQGQRYDEHDWQRLQEAIRTASGTVTVSVERDGRLLDLRPTLITTELPSGDGGTTFTQGSFLGVSPVQFYERQGLGTVVDQLVGVVAGTGQAIVALPQRLPGLFGAVFLNAQRDVNGPIGIVGASRIGGEVLALNGPPLAEISFFLQLLAALNISLFLFNLLPIPPLDGGHIFPAIWEAVRRHVARLRGLPDPGPADVAKLMPVAYMVALVFMAWSGLIFVADVINPVRLS